MLLAESLAVPVTVAAMEDYCDWTGAGGGSRAETSGRRLSGLLGRGADDGGGARARARPRRRQSSDDLPAKRLADA